MDDLKYGASEERVLLIGDVVGSRLARNRRELHETLSGHLAAATARHHPLDPLRVTVGDEFQGGFAGLGVALRVAEELRVGLLADGVDVRTGLGRGAVELLDEDTGAQDGPGWWAARDAVEEAKDLAERPGSRHVRTRYRSAGADPLEPAVAAALLCRDHVVGSLDDRSIRILRGLMSGRSHRDVAEEEGISASAVSQRARRHGLEVLLEAADRLAELT